MDDLLLAVTAIAACTVIKTSYATSTYTPKDFLGTWKVSRMVGAADVHSGSDNPKAPLGTTVRWTGTEVMDIDGTCRIVRATIKPVTKDSLQHDLWGGQPITGLMLPRTVISKTFAAAETPVFDDGGKRCSQAVMLNMRQILLMFQNGYLYLLERAAR